MKRKRHTPEQIIGKLRDAELQLGTGVTIAEVGAWARQVQEVTVVSRWSCTIWIKDTPETKRQNPPLSRASASSGHTVKGSPGNCGAIPRVEGGRQLRLEGSLPAFAHNYERLPQRLAELHFVVFACWILPCAFAVPTGA